MINSLSLESKRNENTGVLTLDNGTSACQNPAYCELVLAVEYFAWKNLESLTLNLEGVFLEEKAVNFYECTGDNGEATLLSYTIKKKHSSSESVLNMNKGSLTATKSLTIIDVDILVSETPSMVQSDDVVVITHKSDMLTISCTNSYSYITFGGSSDSPQVFLRESLISIERCARVFLSIVFVFRMLHVQLIIFIFLA